MVDTQQRGDVAERDSLSLTIEVEEQGSESDELQIEEEDQALVENMVDLTKARLLRQWWQLN